MSFGNGRHGEPERRRPGDHPKVGGNREDDPDLVMARGVVKWSRWLATKKIAAASIVAAAASIVTWVALALTLTPRVEALETSLSVVQTDVTTLKDLRRIDARADTASLYMVCALFARSLPTAIPPHECATNQRTSLP